MNILVTGSEGFIAKNLIHHLKYTEHDILEFNRNTSSDLKNLVEKADVIFHLAGSNRPSNDDGFLHDNVELTGKLVDILCKSDSVKKVFFSSSIQASQNNMYGQSKLLAENQFTKLAESKTIYYQILRLPNIFGKWCKPNYNSVVATFCYNIINGITLNVTDPKKVLNLLYIDDLVRYFLKNLEIELDKFLPEDFPIYKISLGELEAKIKNFQENKDIVSNVGSGLERALFATYLAYISPDSFSLPLELHSDPRGTFVEAFKTSKSGQISFFTAKPGITRGGHFHHTKNERFLVIHGSANFRFLNMDTQERYEIKVSAKQPIIVQTIPGWAHDITNIGQEDLLVLLWANEIFDKNIPDTYMVDLGV